LGALRQGRIRKILLRKIRRGESEPFYERFVLEKLQLRKIKKAA
jgi:sulfide:quinone oxidoreductase